MDFALIVCDRGKFRVNAFDALLLQCLITVFHKTRNKEK